MDKIYDTYENIRQGRKREDVSDGQNKEWV